MLNCILQSTLEERRCSRQASISRSCYIFIRTCSDLCLAKPRAHNSTSLWDHRWVVARQRTTTATDPDDVIKCHWPLRAWRSKSRSQTTEHCIHRLWMLWLRTICMV